MRITFCGQRFHRKALLASLLTCGIMALAFGGESAFCNVGCNDSQGAARTYLTEQFRFPGSPERTFSLSRDGLREAKWRDLGRFFPGVDLFYVFANFERKKFSLLAVGRDCRVVEIHDFRSLNEFLTAQRVASIETANQPDFARLLVRMGKVSGVYGGGYLDGVGTIESAEEIHYRSSEERTTLGLDAFITPPTVTPKGRGFLYHFFSWEGRTTMAVLENTLEWQPETGITFRWKAIRHSVGLPVE